MAQLSGVKTISDSVIEYEGKRYEKTEGPAQVGDIVRNETYYSFMPVGAFYEVEERSDGLHIVDEDGDRHYDLHDEDDYAIFGLSGSVAQSLSVSTADLLSQKRTELDALTEEITQLEARLSEEQALKVGDWARVISRTHNEEFHYGTIVRVIEKDDSSIPYYVETLAGTRDWAVTYALEKLTPTEARAALIAEIDELFTEEAVASAAE
ncbi:hypothetical protein D3C71_1150540 [compost metagenome]